MVGNGGRNGWWERVGGMGGHCVITKPLCLMGGKVLICLRVLNNQTGHTAQEYGNVTS